MQCTHRIPWFGRFARVLGLFWAENGCFWPKTAPIWEGTSRVGAPAPGPPVSFWLKTWIWQGHHLGSKMATWAVRLDFTVSKSPLVPFNSTICPRNGPKWRQKAPKSAQCAPTPRNQARAVSWATWLKSEFRGHLVHTQPPTFCGLQAAESPNEPARPPYQWSLGGAGGQPGPRTVGANGGSTRAPGAKKIIFSKVVPRPLGVLKQVFLGRFGLVVTCFGPWKIPKCFFENGPFWDQKWVKNGSKTRFSKNDPGPFGMLKKMFLAHFEPVATGFGCWKLPKCLESGPFWD